MDAVHEIATRLAEEGVPVAAIARATRIPTSDIWEQLYDAWYLGKLVGLPRSDWPPGIRRKYRTPGFAKLADLDGNRVLNGLIRVFAVSRTEARLLLALIERHDVSNEDLHELWCRREDGYHDSHPAIMRFCTRRLRERLEPFGLEIETIWNYGKRMSGSDRRKALDMLMAELEMGDLQKSVK